MPQIAETDEHVVAVFNVDGELYAIEDVCTHDGEELTGGPVEGDQVELGVSTRGALSWMSAARARAFLDGRAQISIDDLQELAVPSLAHRIVPNRSAGSDQSAVAEEILRELVARVPAPV